MMINKSHKSGALGIVALGLLAGCSGADSDFRSVFSLSGSSSQEALNPYESGKSHLTAGRLGNAVTAFQLALVHNPADVQALNGLGATYDRMGRHDLAEKHYQRALNLHPTNPQTLNNLGFSNLLQGRIDLATALLAEARDAHPTDMTIGTNLDIARATSAAQQAKLPTAESADIVATWRQAATADSRTRVERTTAGEQSLVIEEAKVGTPQTDTHQARPGPGFLPAVDVPIKSNRQLPQDDPRPIVAATVPSIARPSAPDMRRAMPPYTTAVSNSSTTRVEVRNGDLRKDKGIKLAALQTEVIGAEVAENRPVLPSPVPALILSNGTGRAAMARRIGDYLQSNSLPVAGLNNADSFAHKRSTISYKKGWEFYASDLAKRLPGSFDLISTEELAGDIDVQLGADLLQFDKALYYADVWFAPGLAEYPNIVLSNTTSRDNMTAHILAFLEGRGVKAKRADGAKRSEEAQTVIYYGEEWSIHAIRLARLLPADVILKPTDNAEVEVLIALGEDLVDFAGTLINVSENNVYAWSI